MKNNLKKCAQNNIRQGKRIAAKNMINTIHIAALLIAALLFLTACFDLFLPQPPTVEDIPDYETEVQEQDPQPTLRTHTPEAAFLNDGVLRLAMRHPLTLNPLLNEDGTVAKILRLIFEPLVIFDHSLRPTHHLANMELASDFSSATLTIRSDAIWSDGMPVTSDDLIFSVGVLRQAPDTVIYKRNIENIARIDRIDSKTAVVIFYQASMTAGYALNFPIIPEHYYRGHNNPASARNMAPLGNGTFLFESISPMLSMTLARSPYTFRHGATIDEIEVLFIPDERGRLYAFDQGVVDTIRLPFSEWVKHHSVKPVHHEEFPAMYFEFVGFNFQREIFQDLGFRQGIAYTFNADEAMSAVYSHQAVRAVSPIHPFSWMHDNTAAGPINDLARAATLLTATYTPEPLEILVNAEHIERAHIAQRLATNLEIAGQEAIVVILPFDEYYERLQAGDFDLFLGGMQLDFEPDFAFMFQGGPLFGVDPVMEGLLTNLNAASTESAYLQAVSMLQQGFTQRLPIISLGFRHSAVLTATRVTQGRPPATDHIFAFVNEWVID